MSYTIPQTDPAEVIPQEFDLLDGAIRNGSLNHVSERCAQICAAADVNPNGVAWAHLLVGTVAGVRGNHREALQEFQAAIEAPRPLRPRVMAGVAKSFVMLGRMAEAEAVVHTLLAEAPDSWHAWDACGVWQRERGDGEKAWESFAKAFSLHQQNGAVVSNLISLGFKSKRFAELVEILQQHLMLEPLNFGFRGCLVNCLLSTGDYEGACDQAQRIVLFAPFSTVPPELVASMRDICQQFGRM
jgi:tetratricopeptide (TPR) repeat protein